MVMLWQPTHLTFMQVSKIYEVVPPILLETGKVRSNVGLVLSFFFKYHLDIYNEDFTFIHIIRVWIYSTIFFVFDIIWLYTPCKNLNT